MKFFPTKLDINSLLRRITIRFTVVIIMVLMLVSSNAAPGTQEMPRASSPEDTNKDVQIESVIRTSVNLVTIYATVRDDSGHVVGGLRPDNFQVFDNDVPQNVEYFSEEDRPISIGILFDTSLSMEGRIEGSRKALRRFLESRLNGDQFFLITFNTTVTLAQDFTFSADRIIGPLLALRPEGMTALNDAVYIGIAKVERGRHSKRALLLISDGEDNNSKYTLKELIYTLYEANVQLYSIGISENGGLGKEGRKVLDQFAQISGGLAFFPRSMNELDAAINAISVDLRHQYSIGFTPTNGPDGRWHRLKVRVRDDVHSQLAVRSRSGYQARIY